MGNEVVPECQVSLRLGISGFKDVNVVRSPFLSPFDEEPSPDNTELASGQVALFSHGPLQLIDFLNAAHLDQDIDDRLREDVGDGRASHVMNGYDLFAEDHLRLPGFLAEEIRPSGIVRNDIDSPNHDP